MLQRFIEGGWGMWPVLGLGLVALGTALRYAHGGDGRLRPFVESLSTSVLFFSLSAFVTGLIATAGFVEAHPELPLGATLVVGVKESSNNLALGFTLLSLVHLAVSVGRRREAAREPAAP